MKPWSKTIFSFEKNEILITICEYYITESKIRTQRILDY